MLAIKKIMLVIAAVGSTTALAGTMGPVEDVFKQTGYIKLGSGGSYSMNANTKVSATYWDASPQGYNGTVGSTAIYSAAFGYNYSPMLSGDVEFIYRPAYSFSKFQTSTAVGTINFNGDKTRNFDLQSNSVMANLYLHGSGISDSLKMNVMNMLTIAPFIGGGLGVAFNDMNSFYSARTNGVYAAIEQDNFRTALAWQLSAGLELMSAGPFDFAAGYRYYNGGTFSSSTFLIDTQTYQSPWKGTVQANEFFITLGYKINA